MSRVFRKIGQGGLRIARVPLTLLFAASTWPSEGVAAEIQRQVQVEAQFQKDAVMITKITVGDMNVQCGLLVGPREVQPVTPFQAGDDWLQNMMVYIFNRTARTLVSGGIVLGFPELGDGRTQPQPVSVIHLGQTPAAVAFDYKTGKPLSQQGRKPMTFAPGQTLAIHIGDYMGGIRQAVEGRTSLSTIGKVFIYKGMYYFEDGMKWGGGCFSLPVPERPGVFRCIPDDDYFPGDMHNNWPPEAGNGR
jgi:hypothetical protein